MGFQKPELGTARNNRPSILALFISFLLGVVFDGPSIAYQGVLKF